MYVMTGNMNFTSYTRKEAINQIYKCYSTVRVGPPTKVDNLLRRWDISRARHDEIFGVLERDLQALAPTEMACTSTLFKECFDIDTNKSKKAAHGDWTKHEPPRDHSSSQRVRRGWWRCTWQGRWYLRRLGM